MSYGKYWESYPIEHGETYTDNSGNAICVADITKGLPEILRRADMIYSDTPWSLSNVNMFNTKAGRGHMGNFSEFYIPLFSHIREIKPKVCYLEIGKQERDRFIGELQKIYPQVQYWEIKYYHKHPCYLIRGGADIVDFDFTGIDDVDTPSVAVRIEHLNIVGDFCTGRGLTGMAALSQGKKFVGTEMNKRKLAVFIHRARKIGVVFSKE